MIPWRLIGLAGLVAIVAFAGWRLYERGYDAGVRAEYSKRLEALRVTEAIMNEAREDWFWRAFDIDMELKTKNAQIRTVTNVIREEIPIYVTPEVDTQYPLPNSFVWLHDAAASGRPVAGLPVRAGEPHGVAEGIELSDTAELFNANYAVCRGNAEQLKAFQQWATDLEDWWGELQQSWPGGE